MIPFVILKLDKPYNLRFGMGVMIELEQISEIKVKDLYGGMSMEQCATVLWVMLKQKDNNLTLEETIKLVDEYAEDLTAVISAVTKAIEVAFVQEKKGKGNKSPNVRPPASD